MKKTWYKIQAICRIIFARHFMCWTDTYMIASNISVNEAAGIINHLQQAATTAIQQHNNVEEVKKIIAQQ